jgi:hypothetical protein
MTFDRAALEAYASRKSVTLGAWFPAHDVEKIAVRLNGNVSDEKIAEAIDALLWHGSVPAECRHDLARLCGYSDAWNRLDLHAAKARSRDEEVARRTEEWLRAREDPPELSPLARQIAAELRRYGMRCAPSAAFDDAEGARRAAARDYEYDGDASITAEMVARLGFLLDEHERDKPSNFEDWFRGKFPIIATVPWGCLPIGSTHDALLAVFTRRRSRWPR